VVQQTAAPKGTARFRLGSPRAWASALSALAVLSFAAAIPLSLLSQQLDSGVIAAVIGVPCAAVGMVVIRRQRENPLGWLFLVIGVAWRPSTNPAAGSTPSRACSSSYCSGYRWPSSPARR
jgi:hypothetical protein